MHYFKIKMLLRTGQYLSNLFFENNEDIEM